MRDPVVFLPGFMCDARVFMPQIIALGAVHAVMVSPVTQGERIEEIASNVLSAAPARFALAGHSMGGMVALELMRRAPERVTRLALLNTTPLAEPPAQAAERDPQIVRARAGRFEDVMREALKPATLAAGPNRRKALDCQIAMARDLGPRVFERQSRALQRRRDQQTTLARIKVPTLVLCGEHDTLYPVARHSFMAEMIAGADISVIPEAGHLPTLETPDAVNDALENWLDRR